MTRTARTIATTGAVLAGFFIFSIFSSVAKRGLGLGPDGAPPVYGILAPRFFPLGILAIALAVVAFLGVLRLERIRPKTLVAGAVLFLVVFGVAVNLIDGRARNLVAPIAREHPPNYQVDVELVRELGVRGFVREYPELVGQTKSIQSQSHPPGAVVFFAFLEALFPDHLMPRALLIAFFGALILVPTWFIARAVAGETAARYAVALFAVAPSPVLHGFLSADVVHATLLATCIALLIAATREGARPHAAVVGGAAVGFATFFTYATSFIVAFGVIAAFMRLGVARAARVLAWAGLGGMLALGVLRLTFGYDLLASYQASYEQLALTRTIRVYGYWIFANVAVWLAFAGIAMGALAISELLRRGWYLVAMLVPLVLFYALPVEVTHIIPGETERTLLFAMPLGAAAAGAALVRAGEGSRTVAIIVAATAAQTILMEAVYTLPW